MGFSFFQLLQVQDLLPEFVSLRFSFFQLLRDENRLRLLKEIVLVSFSCYDDEVEQLDDVLPVF